RGRNPPETGVRAGDLDHTFPQIRGGFRPTGGGLAGRRPPRLPPGGRGLPSAGRAGSARTRVPAGVPGSRSDREAARPGGPAGFRVALRVTDRPRGDPGHPPHSSHPPGPTRPESAALGSEGPPEASLFASTSTWCCPASTVAARTDPAVRASGPRTEQPPRQGRPFGPTKEGPVRASGPRPPRGRRPRRGQKKGPRRQARPRPGADGTGRRRRPGPARRTGPPTPPRRQACPLPPPRTATLPEGVAVRAGRGVLPS